MLVSDILSSICPRFSMYLTDVESKVKATAIFLVRAGGRNNLKCWRIGEKFALYNLRRNLEYPVTTNIVT